MHQSRALSRFNLYASDWQALFGNSNHLGFIKAQPRPIAEPGQTPPLPITAWTGNQLQMQTLEEGECFRCSTALTRTRPRLPRSLPAQWTFFWAQGQGEGSVLEAGGSCGSLNKVGYRSVVLVKQRHPEKGVTLQGCQIAHHYCNKEKKIICISFGKAHMFFISTCVITSNLHSQITTRKPGKDTSELLKAKHINLEVRRQQLTLNWLEIMSSKLIHWSVGEQLENKQAHLHPQEDLQDFKHVDIKSQTKQVLWQTFCRWVCLIWACQRTRTVGTCAHCNLRRWQW